MLEVIMNQIRVRIGLFLLLTQINLAFALPEDSKAVLEMHAGSADLNQETHRGVYLDQVELDQGTTHIRANKALTEANTKNQLTKAVIEGDNQQQAHYWVLVALDKPIVHAYADKIIYYPQDHRIELIGHAKVEQGDNSFTAPFIAYDTLHQHVTSKANDNERTTIIYHPEKKT